MHPLFNIATHILLAVELWLLLQVADLDARLRPGFAEDIRVDARHDAQQCGLTCPVEAQYADFGAREERQGNVLEDLFFGWHDFADPTHGVDVLGAIIKTPINQ